MTKRMKRENSEEIHTERIMSDEIRPSESQSSDLNNSLQPTTITSYEPYQKSVCGSILHPAPTNSPSEIFSYLRHGKLDALRRSLGVYPKDILQMKNEYGQTILHMVTTHAYQYPWIRVLLMHGYDPCCQDNEGYTSAHYAVERDDIQMLRALTTRFCSEIQPFPEQQRTATHERCLKALSLREKHGLTVFMLACQHESLKCLNYLIELKINDVNLHDNFGDTCLHYAVALRNEILVDKLVNQCDADVNGGDNERPSVLDMLQFNRERQEPFDRTKDDLIEQLLLANNAVNRCGVRSFINKRKRTLDNDESVILDLACLTPDLVANTQIATARNYARIALSFEKNGDINSAQEFYKRAMDTVPNDILDWANYACHVAIMYTIRGENQSALDLLQRALTLRKKFENETEEMNKIQHAIDNIAKKTSNSD